MRPSVAAVCGVILICVFMGIYGWLSIRHIDTAPFFYAFGSIISVNVGVLFQVVKTAKIEDKTAMIENKVDKVVAQTNGALNKLIDNQAQLIEKVDPQNGASSEPVEEVKK